MGSGVQVSTGFKHPYLGICNVNVPMGVRCMSPYYYIIISTGLAENNTAGQIPMI